MSTVLINGFTVHAGFLLLLSHGSVNQCLQGTLDVHVYAICGEPGLDNYPRRVKWVQ